MKEYKRTLKGGEKADQLETPEPKQPRDSELSGFFSCLINPRLGAGGVGNKDMPIIMGKQSLEEGAHSSRTRKGQTMRIEHFQTIMFYLGQTPWKKLEPHPTLPANFHSP